MKTSKLVISTLVSMSIGLSPLIVSAQSTASASVVREQIETSEAAIHEKMNQISAINGALDAIEAQSSGSRLRPFFAVMAAVASLSGTMVLHDAEFKWDASDVEKLKAYREQAIRVADEALAIIEPFEQLRSRKVDFNYWYMEVKKNPEALQKLEALVANMDEKEFKAVATIIARSNDGSWFRIRNAMTYYPETKLSKALARLSLRSKLLYKAATGLLVTAVGAMGYTGFEFLQDVKRREVADLAGVNPEALPMAQALVTELQALEGDDLAARIDAYTLRSVQLSAEIVKLQNEIHQMKVNQALK